MTFYVYDPKGYRLPYFPVDEWRNVRRGHEKQALRDYEQEPRPAWGVEGKQKEARKGADATEAAPLPPIFDQSNYGRVAGKGKEGPLLAGQIMSRNPQTLSVDDTLEDAWNLVSAKRFRHLPILNPDGHVVGMISDRRLSRELINRGKEDADEVMATPITEIMNMPVLTAEPTTAVSEIARVLIEYRIGCLPIVGKDHKIQGILTRSDILRTLVTVYKPPIRG